MYVTTTTVFALLNTGNMYIHYVTVYVSCSYWIAVFTALLVYSFILFVLGMNKVLSYLILSTWCENLCVLRSFWLNCLVFASPSFRLNTGRSTSTLWEPGSLSPTALSSSTARWPTITSAAWVIVTLFPNNWLKIQNQKQVYHQGGWHVRGIWLDVVVHTYK